ncbi:NADH-quinone oxidoreductase subunit L, partial [Acinetobacter baumannii]
LLALGIALVGLAVGIGLFSFAYGAVKSVAKTSLVARLAHICLTAIGSDVLSAIVFVKPCLFFANLFGRDP